MPAMAQPAAAGLQLEDGARLHYRVVRLHCDLALRCASLVPTGGRRSILQYKIASD